MDEIDKNSIGNTYQIDIFVNVFIILIIIVALITTVQIASKNKDSILNPKSGLSKKSTLPYRRWHTIYQSPDIWIFRNNKLVQINMEIVAENFANNKSLSYGNGSLDDLSRLAKESDPSSVIFDFRIRNDLPEKLILKSSYWDGKVFNPPLNTLFDSPKIIPYFFVWDTDINGFANLVRWIHDKQILYRWEPISNAHPWVQISRKSSLYSLDSILR